MGLTQSLLETDRSSAHLDNRSEVLAQTLGGRRRDAHRADNTRVVSSPLYVLSSLSTLWMSIEGVGYLSMRPPHHHPWLLRLDTCFPFFQCRVTAISHLQTGCSISCFNFHCGSLFLSTLFGHFGNLWVEEPNSDWIHKPPAGLPQSNPLASLETAKQIQVSSCILVNCFRSHLHKQKTKSLLEVL